MSGPGILFHVGDPVFIAVKCRIGRQIRHREFPADAVVDIVPGLNVVVAHNDGVVTQVVGDARHQVGRIDVHIIVIVSGIVALQVVAYIDQDGVDAPVAHFLQVGRHVGHRGAVHLVVHVRRIEVGAVDVGGGQHGHPVVAVGERSPRRKEGDQAADAETNAEKGDDEGRDIQYVFLHYLNYPIFNSKWSASSVTGKRLL